MRQIKGMVKTPVGKVIITQDGAFKGRTGTYLYDQFEDKQLRAVVEFEDGLEMTFPKEYIMFYGIVYLKEE